MISAEAQAAEKLQQYVYEYLVNFNFKKAAEAFKAEASVSCPNLANRTVIPGEQPGFLQSWFSVFWDLYCATPDRTNVANSSEEARAYLAYSGGGPMGPMPHPMMPPNGMHPGQGMPFGAAPSPGLPPFNQMGGMRPGPPGQMSSVPSPRYPIQGGRPPFGSSAESPNPMYANQQRFQPGPPNMGGPPYMAPNGFPGNMRMTPSAAAAQVKFGNSPGNSYMGSPAPFGQSNSPGQTAMLPVPSPRNQEQIAQQERAYMMQNNNGMNMQQYNMSNEIGQNGTSTPNTPQNYPSNHQILSNPSSNQMNPMLSGNDQLNEIKQSPANHNQGPASVGAQILQNPSSVHSQSGPKSVTSMVGGSSNDGPQAPGEEQTEINRIKASLFENDFDNGTY
uniref:LisH domain-containing protein n=1 Tax=Rhabditophanes sp. KR3021 TaxID=114890 RepID=A0AC35TXV7_9BILA